MNLEQALNALGKEYVKELSTLELLEILLERRDFATTLVNHPEAIDLLEEILDDDEMYELFQGGLYEFNLEIKDNNLDEDELIDMLDDKVDELEYKNEKLEIEVKRLTNELIESTNEKLELYNELKKLSSKSCCEDKTESCCEKEDIYDLHQLLSLFFKGLKREN